MSVEEITVISDDLDGAELRRAKKNSYHTRCDGKQDNEEINDAIQHLGRHSVWLRSEWWDRIFGKKE